MNKHTEAEWLYQINLVKACNLPSVHWRNFLGNWIEMDPYCVVRVENESGTSKVCEDGAANPTWEEIIELPVHDSFASLADAKMTVAIMHPDDPSGSTDIRHIGTATIPLSDFKEGCWTDKWYQVASGDHVVAANDSATLLVKLLKAKSAKFTAATNKKVQPSSTTANVQPSSATAKVKPAATVATAKPATTAAGAKPAATAATGKPASTTVKVKPASTVAAAKPASTTIKVKPASTTATAKPTTTPVKAKPSATPAKVMTASKPTNVPPCADVSLADVKNALEMGMDLASQGSKLFAGQGVGTTTTKIPTGPRVGRATNKITTGPKVGTATNRITTGPKKDTEGAMLGSELMIEPEEGEEELEEECDPAEGDGEEPAEGDEEEPAEGEEEEPAEGDEEEAADEPEEEEPEVEEDAEEDGGVDESLM